MILIKENFKAFNVPIYKKLLFLSRDPGLQKEAWSHLVSPAGELIAGSAVKNYFSGMILISE